MKTIVVVLVVLLFGRGKISSLMGDVAKGLKVLKKVCLTIQHQIIKKIIQSPITQILKITIKMPQIGWLEILSVVIIAIIVLGPKEFPIALKKIGSYIGKFKNTLGNFQREVSSVTKDVEIDDEIIPKKEKIKKDIDQND